MIEIGQTHSRLYARAAFQSIAVSVDIVSVSRKVTPPIGLEAERVSNVFVRPVPLSGGHAISSQLSSRANFMNPVTFNDKFLEFLQAHDGDVEYCRKAIRRLKKAPLFSLSCTQDEFQNGSMDHVDSKNKIPMSPFPDVRIHLEFTDAGYSVQVIRLEEVADDDDECRFVNLIITAKRSSKSQAKSGVNSDSLVGFASIREESSKSLKIADSIFLLHSGGNLKKLDGEEDEEVKRDMSSSGLLTLLKLAADCTNPSLHPVTVSKDGASRSIEWMKQREHIIFVHKNSPINKAGANGKAFKVDAELKRSAHSRRAHYRLLKSPRYKSKRGTVIFVRSCWVGPKEWEDASGQIYKIVDHPLNPDPKNALN